MNIPKKIDEYFKLLDEDTEENLIIEDESKSNEWLVNTAKAFRKVIKNDGTNTVSIENGNIVIRL